MRSGEYGIRVLIHEVIEGPKRLTALPEGVAHEGDVPIVDIEDRGAGEVEVRVTRDDGSVLDVGFDVRLTNIKTAVTSLGSNGANGVRLFRELRPGEYVVRAVPSDAAPVLSRKILIGTNEPRAEIDLIVSPGRTIEGPIVDATTNEPLSSIGVWLLERHPETGEFSWYTRLLSAQTDSEGSREAQKMSAETRSIAL